MSAPPSAFMVREHVETGVRSPRRPRRRVECEGPVRRHRAQRPHHTLERRDRRLLVLICHADHQQLEQDVPARSADAHVPLRHAHRLAAVAATHLPQDAVAVHGDALAVAQRAHGRKGGEHSPAKERNALLSGLSAALGCTTMTAARSGALPIWTGTSRDSTIRLGLFVRIQPAGWSNSIQANTARAAAAGAGAANPSRTRVSPPWARKRRSSLAGR